MKVVILRGEIPPPTVLWERTVSEDTIQVTPFCLGDQMGSSSKSPKWLNPTSPCHKPSGWYSFYKFLWRAHCMAGADLKMSSSDFVSLGGLRSLTGPLVGLCAEDWKIWTRHSGTRLSPSFWALENRACPEVWMDGEGKKQCYELCLAWPALQRTALGCPWPHTSHLQCESHPT